MFAFIDALGTEAVRLLGETGFDVYEPEQWFPLAEWLTLFYSQLDTFGSAALRKIGQVTSENALWPVGIDSIEKALASIDVAYKMNHRGENLERIGAYSFSKTGDNSAQIVCANPYPCDFDLGIIEAVTNKFKGTTPLIDIVHDESSCRKRNEESCTYHITWS